MKFKRLKKIVVLALSFVLLLSVLSACGKKDEPAKPKAGDKAAETQGDTIKVAAFYNMSGNAADAGVRDKEGTDLAIKHINEKGGIKSLGGAKLEVVYGDLLSDVSQAKAVTERTISGGDIVAAIGVGGSAYAGPQLPVFEKAQIPYVMFGTAFNLTDQGYKYLFRWNPVGGDQGNFTRTQIDYLLWLEEEHGINTHKVGIVYENSDFGISIAQGNRGLAESAGLSVVFEESFPIGLTDASSIVANLKNSGAEAVFVSAFPAELKLIMNSMKSMDYSPAVIGGGAGFLFPEFANTMGDDVAGITSVAIMNWDSKHVQESEYKDVPALYKEEYGAFMCEHAMNAYNNVIILADALERAGSTDGPALAEALRATDLATLQPPGNTTFDEKGDNVNSKSVIVQWQNTEEFGIVPVSVYPADLAGGEHVCRRF